MARLRLEGGASSRTPLKFQQSLEVGHHLSRGLAGLVLASFSAVSDIHTVPEVRLPALGGMIESALLHLWPNSFTDVLKSRQRIIFPKQVKLAMDLIAMDPFRAFIVSDIARECGVSIRTLQYGFRNFASCTIREFVLQQRIEHVARAQHDPEHLASLKATVGLRLLRKLNRLHERSHGRPLISRALLASDCCA
jgi:AraC-like DNA-binding protein